MLVRILLLFPGIVAFTVFVGYVFAGLGLQYIILSVVGGLR